MLRFAVLRFVVLVFVKQALGLCRALYNLEGCGAREQYIMLHLQLQGAKADLVPNKRRELWFAV